MELLRTLLFLVVYLSIGISLSSSYRPNLLNPYQASPGKCGGYCTGGRDPCDPYFFDRKEYGQCGWANDHCCPPYGNGTEWTTTTATTTTTTPAPKKEEEKSGLLKHWKMILIVLGVIVGLAIIGGIGYFLYRKICSKNKSTQENKYNPPALETPGSNYAYAEENPNFGTSDDFYGSGADTTYYP